MLGVLGLLIWFYLLSDLLFDCILRWLFTCLFELFCMLTCLGLIVGCSILFSFVCALLLGY